MKMAIDPVLKFLNVEKLEAPYFTATLWHWRNRSLPPSSIEPVILDSTVAWKRTAD